MARFPFATFCGSLLVTATTACAGADLGAPGAAGPHGQVGSVEASLREDTCWTEAPADETLRIDGGGQTFEAETASGSYGHPGCAHSWIVDLTNTLDRNLRVAGGVAGMDGASQDWCEGFWSESEARGCSTTPCTWTPIVSWSERAKWRPAKGSATGSCEHVFTGTLPELSSDHGFTKIRIVTQAGWVYWYHGAYVRVTVP